MKNRVLLEFFKEKSASPFGRIIALTGARQTGKTTLARHALAAYEYISLDDPQVRPQLLDLSAAQWHAQYPLAVLDEVQKTPGLIESIKAVHDEHRETRYILLGSSQILLMEQVRESLAGRVALLELYPLTLPEMLTDSWDEALVESRLIAWLRAGSPKGFWQGMPARDGEYARSMAVWRDYLQFGAMPALSDAAVSAEEKYDWLRDYIQTYLQRDVRDLANLRDLEPFVRAQQALAAMGGQLLNASALARLAGVDVKTAQRFVRYLEMSYQVLLLRPWFRNLGKRLVKSSKVHFLDPGVQRALLNRRGVLTGPEFESAVVAEIYKQIKNSRLPVECYHLRTVDGREVDLLLELEQGFVALEIKMAERVVATDARHLRRLEDILDKPLLGALVISNDGSIQDLGEGIMAVPVVWALGSFNLM
jgi:hypothetical protein